MENKVNISFKRFDKPLSCGLYDQNNLISLIESAFLAVKPDLLEDKPGGITMQIWCAWDPGEEARLNKSRLFCDLYYHRAFQRKLSERLTAVGGELSAVHSQTLTQHLSGPVVGVSLFDINGVGVDDYVKSIIANPKHWLNALLTLS